MGLLLPAIERTRPHVRPTSTSTTRAPAQTVGSLMSGLRVEDTCCCGAVFSAEGSYAPHVHDRHAVWLDNHRVCRDRGPVPASAPVVVEDRADVAAFLSWMPSHADSPQGELAVVPPLTWVGFDQRMGGPAIEVMHAEGEPVAVRVRRNLLG